MLSNRLVVSAFLIATFAIIALAGRQNGTIVTSNVLVTNSASQPVPVTTTNTVTASVVNTPNVHAFVTNAVTSPVATTSLQDKSRFRKQFLFSEASGTLSAATSMVIPNGSRLIVDSVSAFSQSTLANDCFTYVELEAYDTNLHKPISYSDLSLVPNSGFSTLATGTQPMSFNVEPGETFFVRTLRSSSNSASAASITISVYGHYVPVP